ncbi:MAG: helix-turn-helix transcriptional regulator [Ktedonobacteraceae bacterium]|nr:helix-turn-helix transcriptional regulator [Ktedonobacteraceae bacterium]
MSENTLEIRTPNRQLRHQRELRGWSQKRVALEIHQRFPGVAVTEDDVKRWESGKRRPGPYYREKLCAIFDMDAAALGLIKDEPADATATETSVIKMTHAQAAAFAQLLSLGDKIMSQFDPSKRGAFKQLIALATATMAVPQSMIEIIDPEPWERLARATTQPSTVNGATINHFSNLLTTCQDLSNGTELEVAEGLLSKFLPRLRTLAPYQPEIARLAAQGLQLKSILVAHHLKIDDKVTLCQQAVEHARQANDPDVLISALLELAVALQYDKQPAKALQAYQEAQFYSNQASPVLQARAYVETGAALARCGRQQEALFYLGLAYDTLPDHPEDDPTFAISDFCGPYALSLYDGFIHLDMGKPGRAWSGFEKFKTHPSTFPVPERIRLEIVNHQGRAAIMDKDLDRYIICLEDGLSGAITLKSKKRYNEALSIYRQDVPTGWYKEPRLKDLAEEYHLNVN